MLIYVGAGKHVYYELLCMSESLLKSLNISYKARNKNGQIWLCQRLNWCACFTAISYWANSIQIWFITIHIYRFKRFISVCWNEMKWNEEVITKYTNRETERERESSTFRRVCGCSLGVWDVKRYKKEEQETVTISKYWRRLWLHFLIHLQSFLFYMKKWSRYIKHFQLHIKI